MPTLDDYKRDPQFRPPGDTRTMAGVFAGEGAGPKALRLRSMYISLVKPEDWPGGAIGAHIEATALWKECERFVGLFKIPDGDDPLLYPASMAHADGEPVVHAAAVYYNANHERNYTLGFLCSSYTDLVGNPDDEIDVERDDNRLLEVKLQLHWLWVCYLIRCKLAHARSTIFGWTAGHSAPGVYRVEDMSYEHVSSWQRVNKWARQNEELKTYLEGSQELMFYAAAMDGILAQFAVQTGVQPPSGATSVVGDRFPVPKAWWEGRLPSWYKVDQEDLGFDLNTLALARQFRQQASFFRSATGHVFSYYTNFVRHLDGSPLTIDTPGE